MAAINQIQKYKVSVRIFIVSYESCIYDKEVYQTYLNGTYINSTTWL